MRSLFYDGGRSQRRSASSIDRHPCAVRSVFSGRVGLHTGDLFAEGEMQQALAVVAVDAHVQDVLRGISNRDGAPINAHMAILYGLIPASVLVDA